MDKNYKVNITTEKPLYEQELKEETKAFIKILYINYLAPQEKKEKIIDELKELEKKEKSKIKNDIFENTEQRKVEVKEEVQEIVVYKENKFLNFIKNILKKIKIIK